jgi:hypothetical protein
MKKTIHLFSQDNNKRNKNDLKIMSIILVPPRIIAHSPEHMHMTIREGRDARFSCIATGHPVPTIIWHVNGLSRPGIVTMGM